MTIGIDASEANKRERTGTEWYAYHIIQQLLPLLGNAHTVRLYLDKPLNADFTDLPQNAETHLLRWPLSFFWTQARLSIEMLFQRPDLLFVPAHTLPLLRPKQTITTLHDVGFERFPELYNTKPIGPKSAVISKPLDTLIRLFSLGRYRNNELDYHRFSARFAVTHADHILTVSEFSKKEIQKFYHVPQEKISVVYHGYDRALYVPTQDSIERRNLLARYGIHEPFVYFVGRLEKKKNIVGLVQAFHLFRQQHAKPCQLVLIGNTGYGWEEAATYIQDHHLSEWIVRPGYVPERDLSSIISAAGALVFLSFYEGFGMPLLHAMACGTPIVAGDAASIPEVVGDAALLCDPQKPHEAGNALLRLFREPELAETLRRKGIERAKNFTWEQAARQTYEVFQRFL